MSAQLVLIAALLFPLPSPPHLHLPWSHPAKPAAARNHFGAWTLKVKADKFSGRLACSLTGAGVDYERQAVVIHLPTSVDTTTAIYRIDNGAPAWSRDDQMELAKLGFALHDDDLANPSGGLVRIPQGRLMNASAVKVESYAGHGSTKFKVNGLAAALDAARAAGCVAEDFAR